MLLSLSCFEWQLSARGPTRHLKVKKEYHVEKHHFLKAQNIFEGCKCMQENNRTHETTMSWTQAASGPRKPLNMTPQQRQAQLGNQWNVVQTTAEGSNTMPTRQHPELGQAHRARMTINQCSGRPLAKEDILLRKHSDPERSLSPQNAIKKLAI